MPAIPLLHSWPQGPTPVAHGLFALGDGATLPADWQPAASEYEPAALPTPFARAEATRLVSKRAQELAGAPAGPGTVLWDQFQWLVRGILAGVLRLEPADLAADVFDNLGQALLRLDVDARYFCRIVDRDSGRLMGVTYRSCLVWGHARRTAADWDQLARGTKEHLTAANRLLCEWRETLRGQRRWDSTRIAWQNGVDVLLKGVPPTEGLRELNEHAELQGPIWAEVATGNPAAPIAVEPIYVPSRSPERFARFRALLGCTPRATAAGDAIELVDRRGAVAARIAQPAGGANVSPVALGAGTLEMVQSADVDPHATPQDEALGRLLQPLREALRGVGRSSDPAAVRAAAGLYPDALRFLEAVRAAAAPEGLILSGRARAAAVTVSEDLGTPSEGRAMLDGPSGRIVWIDRLGDRWLLELRALGMLAFRVFVGEATVVAVAGKSRGNVLLREACRTPYFASPEPMLNVDSAHPAEPAGWVCEAVRGEPPASLSDRLATLQRFAATYPPGFGMDEVLNKAARAFAAWARPHDPPVPLGRKADRTIVLYCAAGLEMALGADPMAIGGRK